MKALILLGCPETPSQTPMSIYASYKLSEKGYDVTIAANPAASKLVKVSDPEKYYIQEMVDLDDCLANVQEGEYDLLLGFVHKDAAIVSENTDAEVISVRAFHNPNPIKVNLDKVLKEL